MKPSRLGMLTAAINKAGSSDMNKVAAAAKVYEIDALSQLEVPDDAMEKLETLILAQLAIPDPYIARGAPDRDG